MRKTAIFGCLMLLIPAFGYRAFAQDASKAPEPAHYYHLDFVVQELGEDGKPVNSRNYVSTVNTGAHGQECSIRTGTKVPVATGTEKQQMQYQYLDVGVNIDVRTTTEVGHQLALMLIAEVSSLATPAGLSTPATPMIRQNRWQALVLVPIGKPTVVFTSENLENKGKMQLLVTATPLQ